MSVEAQLIRTAQARLWRAGFKLQTAIKLALSRQGRINFGSGQKTNGPLGKGTVSTLPQNQRKRISQGLIDSRPSKSVGFSRGLFQGMEGRFSGKGKLLGLVQRSAPGEPPLFQSGRLRNSISLSRIDPFTVRVGTNVKYAKWLEFGTKGGKVITPKGKKCLFDPVSRRFFGKRVVQGRIAPRPFFRPTFRRMQPVIMATLAGAA